MPYVMRQTRIDKVVLKPNVLLLVSQLGVFSSLLIHTIIETVMILLESHHPILRYKGALTSS